MKAVILAGGRGSRLSEETTARPKPMVEIGDRPILWHIMRTYAAHGVDEFIVCLGYKGYVIKEYFANYVLHRSDVTVDLGARSVEFHHAPVEPWRVTLVDTGADTMTGGRIKRVLPYLGDDETFLLTYGDGVADLDVSAVIDHHVRSGRLATLTAVQPPARFGSVELDGDRVARFSEKAPGDGAWINGGYFVLSREIGRYIDGDDTVWEQEPLERLAADGQLGAYCHTGFWQPMDTLRDKLMLESLWESGDAPWVR
jgi:glucose-1-phosphate cytidylyltransferase